jgi:hypothetical protein
MISAVRAVLATPVPSPTPGLTEMPQAAVWAFWGLEASDWVTIAVSLIVGLGAAWLSSRSAHKRAEADREFEKSLLASQKADERRQVLRNYEKAIEILLMQLDESGPVELSSMSFNGMPSEFKDDWDPAYFYLSELEESEANRALWIFGSDTSALNVAENLQAARKIVRDQLALSDPAR